MYGFPIVCFSRRYGMAEFSLRNMMVSAIRDDLWDTTECLLVALFWEDKIHPSREHGHLLIADALMRYVERAEQFAAGTRPALRRMERPFMPVADGAWDVPARLCFTLDENGGIPVDKNGTATAPGWNLTDEGRHKWGWVSTTAGARLVVPLDVLALPGAAAGPVELTVTYLQSYEGAPGDFAVLFLLPPLPALCVETLPPLASLHCATVRPDPRCQPSQALAWRSTAAPAGAAATLGRSTRSGRRTRRPWTSTTQSV